MIAFYEGKLRELCKMMEIKINTKININDISMVGGYTNQYWKYLTKVIEVDDTCVKKYFLKLQVLREYRNKIAHENGYISNESNLRKSIKEISGLDIDSGGYLVVSDVTFINEVLDNIRLFFKYTLKAIDESVIRIHDRKSH